jgi:hypothetical protein
MDYRRLLKRLATPIVLVFAIAYFVIDALFVSIIRPILAHLERLPVFARIDRWIRTLGPYPSLALFLVPVILLEPVKPVGLYLIAEEHFISGVTLIVLGEILKITVVERLFHINKDKLLSIRAFALVYFFVMKWLDRLKALPPWQWVRRQVAALKLVFAQAFRP